MEIFKSITARSEKRSEKVKYEDRKNSSLYSTGESDEKEFTFNPDKLRNIIGSQTHNSSINKSPTYEISKVNNTYKLPSYLPTQNKNPNTHKSDASNTNFTLDAKSKTTGKTQDTLIHNMRPQCTNTEVNKKIKTASIKEFLQRNYTQQMHKYEQKKCTSPVSPLDKVDKECTFAPALDEKSRGLANTQRISLYELGVVRNNEKKKLVADQLRKKEEEELKICTFSPKIIKKYSVNPWTDSRSASNIKTYSSRAHRSITPVKKPMNTN